MLELFWIENKDVYGKLNEILKPYLPAPFEILRTENGKPYIEGNPLYFSLSHSGTRAVIALSDKPVGVDMELYQNKLHSAIISRFSSRERAEISNESAFLLHWTAKEAFIKMTGGTLAKLLKRLEYVGGRIFLDGIPQNCNVISKDYGFGAVSVCSQNGGIKNYE